MEKAKSKKKTPEQPARMTLGDRALATGELRGAQAKVKATGQLVVPGEALDGLEADWAKLGSDMTAVSVFERGPNELRRLETPDDYIAAEYPWLEKSQDVPRLLKALLREVVAGSWHR